MKFSFLRKFFNDMLTETDSSYDITRISMFLFVVCYICLSFYQIFFEHKFDFIDWSIGASTILGAGGVTVGARARLEDKMKEKNITVQVEEK